MPGARSKCCMQNYHKDKKEIVVEKNYVYGSRVNSQEIRKTCFVIILIHALIFNVPNWILDIINMFDVYGATLGFEMLFKTIFDYEFSATALFIIRRVIAFILLDIWLGKSEISVTSKKIYGHAGFGEYVEIPLSEVKSVSTCLFKKGICINTMGRKFRFYHINNYPLVIRVVSDLITKEAEENQQIQNIYSSEENFNGDSPNPTEKLY